MKKGKILIGGIIIAAIVSISILGTSEEYQKNTQPVILDNPVPSDTANVNLNPDADSPTVNDSASQQELEFWTDEDGNRHYTITARDSPAMNEP